MEQNGSDKDYGPEIEDTDYDIVRRKLRETKIERKRTEEDSIRLSNRLQLLKMEEKQVFCIVIVY